MELILVIGVIGALATGTVALANTIGGKAKVDTVAGSTEVLVQNLEAGIGQVQSYYGLTTAKAIERNLLPVEFDYDGQASTTWGSLTIEPIGALYNGVRLTFEGVPAGQCVEFINRLAPEMAAIRVNGNLVGENHQVDIPTLTNYCADGGIVALDRIEPHYGRKAMWETWGPGTTVIAGPVEEVPLPTTPTPIEPPPIIPPPTTTNPSGPTVGTGPVEVAPPIEPTPTEPTGPIITRPPVIEDPVAPPPLEEM